MRGLLYKHFRTIAKEMWSFLLLCAVFYAVAFFAPGMEGNTTAIYGMLMMSMVITSLLRSDETTGWRRYCELLPISRKEVVTSYYLVNYGMLTGAILLYIVLMSLGKVWRGSADLQNVFSTALVMVAVSFLLSALSIPITLKFGSVKGPAIHFAVTFMIVGVGISLLNNGDKMVETVAGMPLAITGLIMIAVTAAAVLLSWMISVRVYEKKEY
ncbi:MAG: ABC-2 transporter permease [Lachnospiraceae bacterium]|nr:ABC-2 transporter permease [Lachnospiraceae bacterium]